MSQYKDEDYANIIGSFAVDHNQDFKDNMSAMLESFRSNSEMDPMTDLTRILGSSTLYESYKEKLIGDVAMEALIQEDPYLSLMPSKLEQLFENTAAEILKESYTQQMQPIIGITLPVLKKNFLECHSKDIVMTEVPSTPIIKASFERRYLQTKAGEKHYIPDIFYDDSYKNIIAEMVGKPINSAWYPTSGTGALQIQDLNILEESGGSLATRDSLALDFVINGVQIEVLSDGTTPTPVLKDIALNIVPDTGVNGGAGIGSFSYRVNTTDGQGNRVSDVLVGQIEFRTGLVSASSTSGKIKKIRFGGHLSNENNTNTLDVGRERENVTWQIPDGGRINSAMSVEKVKDWRALMGTDIMSEVISDMSTVLTQIEDSTILDFLNTKMTEWRTKRDLPFGYTGGFVESYEFNATPPVNTYVVASSYIGSELKYNINRAIDELKVKLRTESVMFVMYAHPNHISLIQDDAKWIIDKDTRIGGIQLDYRFGVMTANQNRVHVVSSLKVPKSQGLRIVAYPLTKDIITFKHYKYSLHIESGYRNPMQPLVPNVMATSRYLTTSLLPVQGEFLITGNDFGRQELTP